jgi:hypothetical protein
MSQDEYFFWRPKKSKQYFLNELMVFLIFSCLFVKKIQKKVSVFFHEICENPLGNLLQMLWSGEAVILLKLVGWAFAHVQ